MEHERDRHGGAQLRDQTVVEDGGARLHGVRCPHRDGKRIHPGRHDVGRCLARIRARTRRVDAVLAADLAQLRLDPRPRPVARLDDLGCQAQVLRVPQGRRVEHHGPDAELDRLADEGRGRGVVQVHADRHGGGARGRKRRGGDRRERAVVRDGVLAQLQDDRDARLGRAGDDRLGKLEGDHVEGAGADAQGAGLFQDRRRRRERHGTS